MAVVLNIFCALLMVLNYPICGLIQKHPLHYWMMELVEKINRI